DPGRIAPDRDHGRPDPRRLARQQQLVRARADPPNRARARAHRDLAALELRPELDQQRALLGRELGVKDRSTARAQRGDQAVTTQQARELAQQLERPAASLDPPPWLAKAELEQLAEQRPLALVEHEDAAVGSKLGRILIGE